MDCYDIKKAFPALYAAKPGDVHVVDVPELSFLMFDGHGDPNVSPAYAQAVEALFGLSYAVRATMKNDLGRVHTVGPLEGLWSAKDPHAFLARNKSAWDWTMMISEHGLTFNGKHHEIYLSDPRRTQPAKLRTILRQPVAPAS